MGYDKAPENVGFFLDSVAGILEMDMKTETLKTVRYYPLFKCRRAYLSLPVNRESLGCQKQGTSPFSWWNRLHSPLSQEGTIKVANP